MIGGLFDGYDVGIGVSQPLSFRGGAHALETIFEKLGTASEERGDTPERGRWVLGSELAFANTDLSRAWSTTCESGCGNPSVTLPRNKARSFHECPWYTLSI